MAIEHKNEFDLFPRRNVKKISFKFNGKYIVTEGQPWHGVTSQGGKIVVKAGRKASKDCADWFNDYVHNNTNNIIHTGGGGNKLPDKLHFAFKGTLTVDNMNFEVCIGQGHNLNNWYIASLSILADDDLKNGTVGIRMLRDGIKTFNLDGPNKLP